MVERTHRPTKSISRFGAARLSVPLIRCWFTVRFENALYPAKKVRLTELLNVLGTPIA